MSRDAYEAGVNDAAEQFKVANMLGALQTFGSALGRGAQTVGAGLRTQTGLGQSLAMGAENFMRAGGGGAARQLAPAAALAGVGAYGLHRLHQAQQPAQQPGMSGPMRPQVMGR